MSFLTEPLKTSLTVEGKSYPINTDFRVWLKIYELTKCENLSIRDACKCLILCYKGGALPPSFFEASNAMWEFFLGNSGKTGNGKGKSGERIFDFVQDAELIYASFMSDYGIDLIKEDMHWHKFLSLFKNLSPDSPFMRVAAIRSINPRDIKDTKHRQDVIKKQRIFALSEKFDEERFAENLAQLM